jgi:signal transduction histidine kinase
MHGKQTMMGVQGSMINATNRLFCRLDGLTSEAREEKRSEALKNLGLSEAESIPVFDEATQTAARFLEAPICLLTLVVGDRVWFKSAVGLSSLGLMNQLASTRMLSREDAFCTYVVDSQQNLIVSDTLSEPALANSVLTQHYGIRAYLGTPLMTADGQCIGALAVMDLVARQFTPRDIEFLALSARWCLREFEREQMLKMQPSQAQVQEWLALDRPSETPPLAIAGDSKKALAQSASAATSTSAIKLKLLGQLTQDLRSPLTAVIGMASVLIDEVFGTLNNKQKEYLQIIHNSGQQMNALVNDILKLGLVDENAAQLKLASVNVEMLCQQTINSLADIAKQKRQALRLSIEPGKRIWSLDKDKVQQALYFLVASIIAASEAESEVRIHFSRRSETLNIAVWVSHPWLGDGVPQISLPISTSTTDTNGIDETFSAMVLSSDTDRQLSDRILTTSSLETAFNQGKNSDRHSETDNSQTLLGLILGCHLAESHGGKIAIQGSSESGYRYVLMLPKIKAQENELENSPV